MIKNRNKSPNTQTFYQTKFQHDSTHFIEFKIDNPLHYAGCQTNISNRPATVYRHLAGGLLIKAEPLSPSG